MIAEKTNDLYCDMHVTLVPATKVRMLIDNTSNHSNQQFIMFKCVYSNYYIVPGADDNAREAQDTPIISVESNRNDTEAQEVVKTRKNKHHKLSKGDSTMSGSLGSSAATFNDEAPGAANSPAAGIIMIEKFYT